MMRADSIFLPDASHFAQMQSSGTREYGLSFAQHAVWHMLQRLPGQVNDVLCVCARVDSLVDKECMRAAVSDLIARHPALRATFGTHTNGGMARAGRDVVGGSSKKCLFACSL